MKLYISSRMKGLPLENYPAFFMMERKLKQLGHEVVNPARIGLSLSRILSNPSRRDYLTADIMELLECDGIVLFGDWEHSAGAYLEAQIAIELDIPVFYFTLTGALERLGCLE